MSLFAKNPALDAKLAEAQAALAASRDTYADAALAAEDDPTPAAIAARETARKAIDRTQAALADIEAAAKAGAKRKERMDAEAKQAETARRWIEAEALAKKHDALAKKIEKIAQDFAATLAELHTAGDEFFHTAPQRSTYLSSSMMAHDTVDGLVRLELRRHGLEWAAKYFAKSELPNLPTFTERMAAARYDILRFKEVAKTA